MSICLEESLATQGDPFLDPQLSPKNAYKGDAPRSQIYHQGHCNLNRQQSSAASSSNTITWPAMSDAETESGLLAQLIPTPYVNRRMLLHKLNSKFGPDKFRVQVRTQFIT